MRRLFVAALLGAFLWHAPVRADLMEGVDYESIPPHPTPPGGKIQVIEFFYYGCGSCNRFEPMLAQWLAREPADVEFIRMPALRRAAWIPLTRLYLALEETGALPRLHSEVYHAVHEEQRNLTSMEEILDWAASKGLDRARFEHTLASDAVAIKTQRAHDTTIEYGIRSTPSLVVDGRYLTTGGMLGSVERLVPVLNQLLDMVRRERAGRHE